jgi:preprotein translocase SecE subunit
MAQDTKVRRLKATEAEVVKKPQKSSKKPAKSTKKTQKAPKKLKINLKAPQWLKAVGRFFAKAFGPFGRYFKGAWQELRVTKWPNRRSTWGLTLAVILFSIFFALLVLLFDDLFEWLITLTLNIGGN